MATIKINVMSIVAIILTISAIIAAALLEAVGYKRSDYTNTYLAFLIIAIILALVVLIVTCVDLESVTGKTFLIYLLIAIMLLVGIILFGLYLDGRNSKQVDFNANEHYASIVFAVIALVAAIAGTVAPFVCNK